MTLVVAAVAEELGSLAGEVVGVGLVAAAVRMARLIQQRRPSRVVLLGTAGAFAGGPDVGTVVAARRLGVGDPVAMLGLGYQPAPRRDLLAQEVGIPAADVITNLAITSDGALAARFAVDWQVEHMEAYGVAWACEDAGVAFAAVFGIANRVGPEAHAEWLANRSQSEHAARACVARLVRQGSGG